KECQPENGIFFAITVLKITPRRQPCGDFMLCSNKKYAHFQVRGSFGKVILAHKGITKTPAYSRIQAFFNVFRGKRTKPKPNLLYDGRPKGVLLFGADYGLARLASALGGTHADTETVHRTVSICLRKLPCSSLVLL
ncbi:MAG: hypothetical protein IJ872_06625, partial [Eubacterium sp.]|nr:hypothetical protein [Eubacterium sp.]